MPRSYDRRPSFGGPGYGYGGGSLADIYLRGGEAQARAARESGAIWADAIQNAGNILGQGVQEAGKQKDEQAVGQAVGRAAMPPPEPGAMTPGGPGWSKIQGEQETAPAGGWDPQAILASVKPELRPRVMKALDDAEASRARVEQTRAQAEQARAQAAKLDQAVQQNSMDLMGTVARHAAKLSAAGDDPVPYYQYAAGYLEKSGVQLPLEVQKELQDASDGMAKARAMGDPGAMKQIADLARSRFAPFLEQAMSSVSPDLRKQWAEEDKPDMVVVGGALVDKKNPGKGAVYTAPEKKPDVSSFEGFVVGKYGPNPTPEQILEARKAYGQADDKAVSINMSGMNALYSDVDPKAIAEAIQRGESPPDISALGRPVGAAVASELAKGGFNLAAARTDWNATQKHMATLNGAQQTRLRQAVNTADHSLDVIEDLAKKWKGGRFPALNKASLAAAKAGAQGVEAQKIATQLEAQITDVTSELANVYMGGNSPTDHALQLAAKNLSAEWSEPQLLSLLDLARKNLRIRNNSIANVGVIGVSEDNRYAPKAPSNSGRFKIEVE